jgi:hypothetical protein
MEWMKMYVLPHMCEHASDSVLQGKTRNFAHPALREAIVTFFYTGPYQIAGRRSDIFSKRLPLTCLALVGTAVFFHHREARCK